MYMYAYVYMICVHLNMCICVYVYTFICICVYAKVYEAVCIDMFTHDASLCRLQTFCSCTGRQRRFRDWSHPTRYATASDRPFMPDLQSEHLVSRNPEPLQSPESLLGDQTWESLLGDQTCTQEQRQRDAEATVFGL